MSAVTRLNLTRIHGWELRLYKFLQKTRMDDYSLDWSHWNCAMWSADAVMTITGVDAYAEFRGKVTSPISAYKAIKGFGFDGIEEVMDYKLDRIPYGQAWQGDFVLAPAPMVDLTNESGITGASPEGLAEIASPDASATPSWRDLGMAYAVCM